MNIVSELLYRKSETYEVYNFHEDLPLRRPLLFQKKCLKCMIEISRVISCKAMNRPAFGFVISFPSKLGCGTIQGHVGEDVIEKIFAGDVRGEVNVAKNFVFEGNSDSNISNWLATN